MALSKEWKEQKNMQEEIEEINPAELLIPNNIDTVEMFDSTVNTQIRKMALSKERKEQENMQEEIEKINPAELLTPNDVIDTVEMFDSTVEVVGYVDSIESPRIVGSNQQYKFFKFYLNNGNGRRIQVVAWNDDIENILHFIMPNHIVHLDGVQARVPKVSTFNNGNVTYELLIRKNTIVNNLGKYVPCKMSNKPIQAKLSEVLNITEYIMLEAYVKSNFAEIHDNKLNKLIGYGSITDGIYKLEIHIANFYYDDYLMLDINKGDKIQITGIMQTTVNPIYLLVNDINDIHKLDGHMPFSTLLKGVQPPCKRKTDGETSQKNQSKRTSL